MTGIYRICLVFDLLDLIEESFANDWGVFVKVQFALHSHHAIVERIIQKTIKLACSDRLSTAVGPYPAPSTLLLTWTGNKCLWRTVQIAS